MRNDGFVSLDLNSGTVCGIDEKDQRSHILIDWNSVPFGVTETYLNLSFVNSGLANWGPAGSTLN